MLILGNKLQRNFNYFCLLRHLLAVGLCLFITKLIYHFAVLLAVSTDVLFSRKVSITESLAPSVKDTAHKQMNSGYKEVASEEVK
jgi:hypothetical protein